MYPSSNYSPNISGPSSFFHINIPSPSMQYEPEFIQYFHDLHFIQPAHDQNNIDNNIMGGDHSDKLDKREEDQLVLNGSNNKKDETSSTTTSTIRRKNNKRTTRSGAGAGGSKKDRHSKINTAHGPRDRRMRLSLEIARKFFNLQDLLGFDKASKTVEWLLMKSKSAINELVQKMNKEKCSGITPNIIGGAASPSESCEVISGVIDESAAININDVVHKQQKKKVKSTRRTIFHPVVAKESRKQARERARERTKIKKSLNDNNINDIGKSMVDDDDNLKRSLGSNYWNTFEDHQSGIQQGYNNNNNNTNNIMDVVDSFNLVDTGNWSPFIFNYQQINTEISQEHQLTNFHYSGKLWEA